MTRTADGRVVDAYLRHVRSTVHSGTATVTGPVLAHMGLTVSSLCSALGGAYVVEQASGAQAWTIRRMEAEA